MHLEKGLALVADFIKAIDSRPGFSVQSSPLSRNVFRVSGKLDCLLYIKGRSQDPLRWGVTANVIERLRAQKEPWAVILLYVSIKTGYLLSASDVQHYVDGVWALGADGDFKPSPGGYLAINEPFHSIDEFVQLLTIIV